MAHFVTGLQPALMESAHRSPHQGHSTPSHQGHFPPAHQGHHPPSHTPHPPKPKPPTSIELHHVQAPSETDGNTAFLRAARAGHLDKVLEHLKTNIDINTSNANGLNALHLASKDGHVNVVTELLKRGASVDAATKKGNTALHIASLAGQEEVVKLLVQHGAAVNVQSQNGFTPLYMAAQENHDNVVRFLLANGANQSLATEDGFTPLAVAMQQGHDKVVAVLLESDTRGKVRLPALHIAAKKDDCKAAALLLQNEHNPDVTSKSGFTPLHIAAHYGNENIANLLLQKGADVNYSAKHNITPLHVAAKWGKSNMVALLLEKGGNIESKTRDGLTPLHCAARSGHEQVVDMLLERGAPISSKTKNGLAPLHMASQGDHVDAARILLYHRAPVDEVTVDYLTALHVAAHCGHVRVAKLLLDRKADPDARALNGFTPLHIACKKNRIKVVELLLKHGASIEATTESGLTPLHVASFMGCMNIVIFLLQHNANPDVPTVRGETPLHLAARANQTDIIRILLRNGAQVDARAREQQTPLHIASRLGNVDIVMLLLQHGAQIDATTKDMYTALHIAAKEGQEEVASVLLEHGAALTATTKKGFTPLHLAAKYGNIKVAQLLLQRDAPVDAQGKNGVTPLHVASHYDHQNVALLLLDKGASPHATAKNGHTPLHIAARKNQMDIATTLLEYGAKADAESKAGFTPLHLSAQEGHTDMTNLLIEHHAEPDHKAKNGLTPLHLCSQEDKPNVAAILIKNNAEVDATTKAGYTPLHVASHFGQVNTVRFLLEQGADVKKCTSIGYTPLHQAAQQGHATIVQLLLDNGASPNAQTSQGQTALSIAQKLGYISVVEALKGVTTDQGSSQLDEKYRVVAPETMQEIFMSDSEDENGEDTMLSDQPYRYLTVDEMKSLGDDSLPIDVTRDERIDSNKEAFGPGAGEDVISPQHAKEHYAHFANLTPDNVDISRHPINVGKLQWRNFLVSFLVDARGGAMRGCRHSGVRVIIPPRKATMPMRVTCRYLKRDKLIHPPPLMEGEALASRVLELGPVGAKFLGPVIIEVPHFASLRGSEREIVILRSDNGETWREHTMEASDEVVHDVLNESFDGEELSQIEDLSSGRITRILTNDFPQYFAIVSRIRQEVHPIGPDGGMVSSSVVPQVQAVFPQGALTKKIKVGLQAQPISAELTAKLLGNRVAVSPIVTVEPRRRKFHKPITLTIPVPRAANKGMINQYSGDAPTLRLLCSITGGTSRAQWEDVTGSTPLTFVNDCVSFTTTVSARFWLMDCRNIAEATKMATELYREAIHVPFMAKFVVFAKRVDVLEARLRVFCMTDDREDKTLEHQEHFTEVAKSRDVEVLEGKAQYVEFAGNLVPVTKSGDQLRLGFKAFRENRLPFTVRVKDPHVDSVGRLLFMREAKVGKGDPPQQPICCLNIVLPETIMPDSALSEPDLFALQKKISSMRDSGIEAQRTDLRLSDISNLLGYDWVNLAPHLGIQESDISLIKTESPANVAQQARAMLRLWLYLQGNKASGKSLETALNRINRSDIAEQCIFNEQIKSKTSASKDVMGITRTEAFDERDIMKVSESVEDLMQSDVRGKIKADERDEKKYLAEEKDVEEEEQKTVKEIKQEIERRLSQEKQYSETQRRSLSISDEKLAKPKQPQRHSVAADFVHTEIKAEEISKPEKGISEKEEEPEKPISVKEKISQFQKISSQDETTKTTKTTEIETQIERKHQTVQEIMESESKKISDEIKGDSTKMTKTTENIIISQKEDTTKVVEEKVAEKTKDIINQEEKLLDDLGKKKDLAEEQTTFLIHEQASEEHRRRDSELLEGVTESLGKLGKIEEPSKDLLSPKVSKTPPPSPADFLNRGSPPSATTTWTQPQTTEPTATQLEYSEKGQSEEYVRETQGIRSDQVTEPIVTASLETEPEIKSEEPQQDQESQEKPGDIRFEELDTSKEYSVETESTGFVTTPTSKRRVQSQRISRDKCPSVTPYQGEFEETYSSDEEEEGKYTVDEPGDTLDDSDLGRIHSSPDIYGPVFTHKRKESSLAETQLEEEEPPGEGEAHEELEKNGSVAQTPAEPKPDEAENSKALTDSKTDLKEVSITESIEKSEKTFEGDGADVISEASQSIISNTETLLDAPRTGVITDSGISTASKDISDITETDEGKKPEVKEEPDESEQSESDGKHRVIFHIESEEDLQSDIESDQVPVPIDSSSSTEEFIEKVKQDLKTTLEREQLILEEKLAQRSRIFDDLSDESLSKTKELVDERLRKISESKTPKEVEEPIVMTKKEKSPVKSEPVEEITIGRFHVTPAQVTDPLLDEDKEKLIADRLKTDHQDDETKEEVEKELPEKLTEEDFEEVIRELKMEGLQTDVYLEKDPDKEEKKEKTLRRVERRFERMASETLEKDKEEENVSEEKLTEKHEVEFQRMISQLSTEEVAECQQEYLQLWEEGGLSSLTPTDDWESRDPDTPENELEEDSPRKPESYRGSHGQGKHEESIKYPDTKKSSKTPDVSTNIKTSPLESVNISDDISPVTQNLGIVDPLKVGSSPSETQQTSEFGSDEVQSYGDRKKFWEQMSSSHSSEGSEHRRSFHESVSRDSFEIDKRSLTSEKETESSIEEEHISVKSAREKFERQEKDSKSLDTTEKRKSTEEGGLVKSLTESFSEKIFAGELVMPAAPRPKSGTYRDVIEGEEGATTPEAAYLKKQIVEGSSGTQEVSELEAELARRRAGAPITDETVISGSTGLGEEEKGNVEFSIGTTVIIKDKTERKFTQGASTDSEAEFISKYGEESVAFENSAFLEDDDDENIPLSERKKVFQENLNKRPPPIVPIRTSLYERSMSLPPQDLPEIPGIRDKKRYFENQLQKEIVVEQLMTQQDEECSTEYKSIADCRKPWKPEEHKKIFGDKLEEKAETSEEAEVESRKSWKEEADKEKERTQSLIQEKRKSIEVKETAVKVVNELIKEGAKAVEEKLIEKEQEIVIPQESELSSTAEEVIHYKSDNLSKPSDSLEVHVDKSEIEENEKEKDVDEVLSAMDKREDGVPSITITHSGKRQTETSSIGESEDTQSESDVTPEDARVVDNGAVPWESGGNSPKDDVDIGQTGMGRWVGQEDLSKETWEKDDIDSRVYQIEPKWERTRSEGASPKEQFVYTPEEHYPDTVWEVPVQEQLETEEITQDIPIEKQVIIEKDEEEEEEEEEEEVRDIRDTELTEEEAREIAEEILDYIQFEVENRSSLLITDLSGDSDKHPSDVPHPQVSDYLRQLAGEKNLDDREVELIESVLVQKHREQILKLRNNETTSSQEITDEDLRSSGVETDLSPLDSQAGKLQILGEEEIDSMETSEGIIESRLEELDEKSIKEEMEDFGTKEEEKVEKKLKDEDIVEQTIAEVKESLEAAQEELIEQHKKKRKEEIFKKESPSEFEFKGISYEKSIDDKIEERYYEETEGTTEYETVEDGQKIVGRSDITAKDQFEFQESDKARIAKQELYTDHGKIEHKTEDISQSQKQIHDITVSETTTQESEKEFLQKKISAEISDEDEKSIQSKKSSTHFCDEERGLDISQKSEDIKSTQSSQLEEKYEDVIFKKMGDSEHYQTKVLITKSSEEATEQKTYEQLSELEITPESTISKKFDAQRTSMEDSPKSASQEESMKSPLGAEEYHSSSSSIGKHDELLKSDKSGIVLRHSSSSGTGGLPKADRRSGTDLEPYSSSGESHYHSLDQSRPCSSDVEALLAGGVGTGSSEYESALSQELSSRQTTSGEYVTAVSSLSSRESIKSLDSESSGHLASIEVSSEASETLIPSALELDRDFDSTGAILLDDDSPEMLGGRKAGSRPPPYVTQMSAPATANRGSVDEDFEVISESEVVSWTGEVSEDEATEAVAPDGEEQAENGEKLSKLKRSHEMTFQPEPRPIESAGSLETSPGDIIIDKNIYGSSMDETASMISMQDERFGSLEETGSVLSMSLSTASETSAVRTVIELSRTDSEKMDGSLTVSVASADSGSRDELDNLTSSTIQPQTNEMSTSTPTSSSGRKTASVTITTSAVDEHGISSVSTQVTSVSRKSSMADDQKSEEDVSHANGPTQVDYVPEYDEVETTKSKKTHGHRRKESTSNFVPTMQWTVGETKSKKEVKVEMGGFEERTESDKYVYDVTLTEKEVKNDEKKESDDCEKPDDESYDTEADQGFHQDLREGRIYEDEGTEDDYREIDGSRPQSQISKTDSESGRRPQSILSEDQPDSELSELMKQGSSDREDPIERPASPEPEELENKDDTPEFSSEAQASVTELEMEYSGAYSRRDEYASHVSPVREEKFEHEKITEAEAAFSAVPHTIPHLRSSLPEAIIENPIAEKHELEEREKESLRRKVTEIPTSPGDIPDITVTQHMTPLLDRSFHYPDLELEAEERKLTQLEETPELMEKDEYEEEKILQEDVKPELPLSKIEKETKIQQKESESLDSPNSDSFEMLDKPDISDEYVIIEEVGKEAEEHDQEGKGVTIAAKKRKITKKGEEDEKDELISSPPAPATKLTELKYFPGDEDVGPFPFDSDSPPIATDKQADKLRERISKEEEEENEYEQQLEESKKWIEMQFQGEQAAKVMGGYGYEIEYERGPLEDIKEEEIGELDSSSKIGSMGSQKESLGSFGSVKDSFSSTPDYDVLAGRKYFTRSGDHDDVSMSSLQEFELLEKKILMENGKKSGSSSSQDSLSSKKLGTSNKSGQGDDLSLASLREFEILENACVTVVKIEHKAKEEEAMLSEIDEGHESQVSESESCETVSGVIKDKPESDSEDFDKRMFEIDEIIKQAQSNVEKFTDLRGLDKTESVGRGDSFEEVAKVPDLELDAPLHGKSLYESDVSLHGAGKSSYSTQVVTKKKVQKWREEDELKKSESLEIQSKILSISTDSLEVKGDKIMTTSTDSLELEQEKKKKGDIMTDSIEMQADTMSIDSFDLQLAQKPADTFSIDSFDAQFKSGEKILTDSMEEDESFKGRGHESSSSGRDGEYSSSGREDSETYSRRAPPRSDYMLGSTDSLDPTSSTATHATYQYETDSVMSSSFTSGGSNTMVSSTDNLDLTLTGKTGLEGIDISNAATRTGIWFESLKEGGEPIVSEIFEPLEGDKYSHTIHRTVEMAPEIRKVVFKGPDAEKALKEYVEGFAPGEDVIEVQEKDEHGNIHVKRIVKRKMVVRPEDFGGKQPTEDELEAYLRKFEKEGFDSKQEFVTEEFGDDFTSSYPSQSFGQSQTTAYSSDKKLTGKEEGQSSTSTDESGKEASATEKETGISRRPPLVSDISMDDEAEYDTTEHDWRHQLEILHAEADEGEIDEQLDAALASSFSPHK